MEAVLSLEFIKNALDEFYSGDMSYFLEQYGYVEEILNRTPKYSAIDAATAAELANLCLAASITCTELIHDISRQVGELDVRVKAEEANAMSRCTEKRSAVQKYAAQNDKKLIDVQLKASAAKSFLDLLKRKYQILICQHYNCKSVAQETHSIHLGSRSGPTGAEDYL